MNLCIDQGNSRTKVGLFSQNKLMEDFKYDQFGKKELSDILVEFPVKNCIISSVLSDNKELIEDLNTKIQFSIELTHDTALPIVNSYSTPETLGNDRLAAVVGASFLKPESNILVIDAGTAITYDFVNMKNQYQGGFITPGLNMRFRALNHFTDKLPLIKPQMPGNFYGKNTNDSIMGGVQYGLEGEINRMIQYFNDFNGKLTIIITGGDSNYFEILLKSHKFVTKEIMLLGLNTILEFNYPFEIQE